MKIDELIPWGQQQPTSEKLHANNDWRFERPTWDAAKCVRCGMCYIVCPDSAISQNAEGSYEANPDYCKGCGLCVQQCLTGCISLETTCMRPPWLAKNF